MKRRRIVIIIITVLLLLAIVFYCPVLHGSEINSNIKAANLTMATKLLLIIGLMPMLGIAQRPDATAKSTDSLKFAKLEIESSYPGGRASWIHYLNSNMHYPTKAMRKNIQGTVVVQFIIEANGNVSDVEAIEGPNMLMDESVRLIKESGKWIPAQQNGQRVKSYKKQPFVFRLEHG